MPFGDYKDIKFADFSGGLNTKIDSNMIADNESPDMQNVIFDGKGSLMPRLGNTIFGASTSASGKIRRTWTTVNVRDEEIAIRQVDNGTTAWLEYYNPQTSAWENLDAGYATGVDFGNAYYNYYTYYCSQKDWQRRWTGICWSTSTYADSAYHTLTINTSACSAIGFLSAGGSVVVDGEEVAYTTYSAKTLSGITFTTSHNGNAAIAQLPTSAGVSNDYDGGWVSATSTLPKGSIMYEMDAQMFITGASGVSGNVVYYSAVNEPVNYTLSAIPGGGGTARYPETVGGIRALTDFDTTLTILKDNTIRRLKFQQLADGTAGALEIVNRQQVLTAPNIGAANNKGLTNAENDVVYVSPAGWVKSLNKTVAGVVQTNEISAKIRNLVENMNFNSTASIYFDGKIYVAAGTSDSAYNNVVLVYDTAFGAWTKFVGWCVNDWFIYNNVLYYGASNEIATYRVLYNYDDNGAGYNAYWASKQWDFGVSNEQKRLGMVYIEGWITENTTIGVSSYFDGDYSSPTTKSIDGSNTDYVIPNETLSFVGSNTWGLGTYGGGSNGSNFNLRKFRYWGRMNGKSFYNLQIKIGTANPGYVYKITHIIPYLDKVPGKRIPGKNIK